MRGADDAVITRELARAVAFRLGHQVSFTPIPEPHGLGNGTHIHWSLLDRDAAPVLHDAERPGGLTPLASRFVAGIQHHLPALCAVTAPSVASYYRLRPDRWAPVRADVGLLDRGAAVRICAGTDADPVRRARQFNIEYRVADATANPYLALAALVHAGLDGVRERLEIEEAAPRRLPASLREALELLAAGGTLTEWFGSDLSLAYLEFKRAEIAGLEGLDETEICRRYTEVY